ncbi:MAG: hypothetical protein RLY31_2010 [Bacteroidota bacterium]|jgi:hypothetical protein
MQAIVKACGILVTSENNPCWEIRSSLPKNNGIRAALTKLSCHDKYVSNGKFRRNTPPTVPRRTDNNKLSFQTASVTFGLQTRSCPIFSAVVIEESTTAISWLSTPGKEVSANLGNPRPLRSIQLPKARKDNTQPRKMPVLERMRPFVPQFMTLMNQLI